jgi:predicted DNA-binding protein (MmcQ/YjbR family)
VAWGAPTFRVDRGKMFLMFADNHHDDGREAIWCRTSPDTRETLRSIDADRYFVPPYVGPSGWVGVRLEGRVDWGIVEDVIAEAHRLASPASGATRRAKKTHRKTGRR